ncbi:MAG: HDOD domain-containing protein [Verrucomicrobia bacterium]|nr:HDOD domain-containing protein [Verrucomicrobiota bacterium]
MSTSTLEILVGRIEQLPSLPTVVYELVEVCKDPNATMAMVEDVIRTDQSLTARMLKLVNSAFFALSNRVSTIHHAAVILGMDALRNTAIAVCTYESLRGCDARSQFDRRAFWEHAVSVGVLAKELAGAAKFKKPDEAFVAGLLHDLGRVVLDKYFPEEFGKALRMSETKGLPLAACEEAILGFDHCVAGAAVARKWRFPGPLVAAIEQHHAAEAPDVLCALVMVADEMAKAWGYGASGNPVVRAVPPSVWDFLPANEGRIREIAANGRDEILSVRALFSGSDAEEDDAPKTRSIHIAHAVPIDSEPPKLVFISAHPGPFHPLLLYFEQARFDVLLLRPNAMSFPLEAECVLVQMPAKELAEHTLEELSARFPHVGPLPSVCVGEPCVPDAAVTEMRGALAQHAARV